MIVVMLEAVLKIQVVVVVDDCGGGGGCIYNWWLCRLS